MPEKRDERVDKIVDLLYEQMNFMVPLTKEYLREVINSAVVFDKKQQDYSSDNIAGFGEIGVMIRMNDKFSRLKNLLLNNKEPQNESVEDTWLDIGVYGFIGKLVHDGIWPGQKKIRLVIEEEEK